MNDSNVWGNLTSIVEMMTFTNLKLAHTHTHTHTNHINTETDKNSIKIFVAHIPNDSKLDSYTHPNSEFHSTLDVCCAVLSNINCSIFDPKFMSMKNKMRFRKKTRRKKTK